MVLPIVRSLGRRGLAVDVGWCPPDSPVRRSRFVRRVHCLPLYDAGAEWQTELERLVGRRQYDLVVPATEPAVVALRPHRGRYEQLARLALVSDRVFDTVFDKSKTERLAASLGIPVPESTAVRTLAEAEAFCRRLRGPVVVKPLRSVCETNLAQKQFVRAYRDHADCLRHLVSALHSGGAFVLQEWVAGHGVGVEFLAREGRILFAFQHRRLHETSGHGSTYRMSVPLEARFLGAARSLVKALDYTGVGMCEFRVDDRSGRHVLLEVNGRFWGSLPLAVACGADFPSYLYDMLVENRDVFEAGYHVEVRSRDLRPDLRWMWRALTERAARENDQVHGWGTNPATRWTLCKDVLRLLAFRDRVDSFAWDDPAPALGELQRATRSMIRTATGRVLSADRRLSSKAHWPSRSQCAEADAAIALELELSLPARRRHEINRP